jgi:hypothetical protein
MNLQNVRVFWHCVGMYEHAYIYMHVVTHVYMLSANVIADLFLCRVLHTLVTFLKWDAPALQQRTSTKSARDEYKYKCMCIA